MRLNPRAFNRHLANIGQEVYWRRSWACACVNPVSGSADPKHALCGGKGRFWDDPISTVVGVASQSTVAELANQGLWESGDMVASVPEASAMYEAGQYDRVVMLNSSDVFSQPFQRGAPTERLIFSPESLTRVFWLDPVTRLPVDGTLPTISDNGVPSWPNGGGPPLNSYYSLTGTKMSEYFILQQLPSDRNEHSGARLPKKVQLRKWDLFGR